MIRKIDEQGIAKLQWSYYGSEALDGVANLPDPTRQNDLVGLAISQAGLLHENSIPLRSKYTFIQ